jgi:hypothetical protein
LRNKHGSNLQPGRQGFPQNEIDWRTFSKFRKTRALRLEFKLHRQNLKKKLHTYHTYDSEPLFAPE